MDVAYCSIRRDLEDRSWNLSSRLFELSSRLLALVGKNHRQFLDAKALCEHAREDIDDSLLRLRIHRQKHGC